MTSTSSLSSIGLVLIVGASLAHGCSSDVARAPGSVGSPCSTSAACDAGLVCLSQLCVQPAAADAGGGAGSGGIRATGGAAGGGPGMACTAATMLAPAGGLITDFTAASSSITGAPYPYPPDSPARPSAAIGGGALHITENGTATSAAQYVGVALSFADCIDATAFTGIQFSIAGAFSGCTMQYATGDSGHQDPATGASFATGPSGGYPPQSTLTAAQVTSTPQTLMMPFAGNDIPGNPQTPLDKTKVIYAFWQFTIPAGAPPAADGGSPACIADITIDNLAFY